MANKFDGDVRPLSNDARYMGVIFSGPMDEAIRQAKDAPDHGLSEQFVPAGMSRDRAVLLEHLNLLPTVHSKYSFAYAMQRGWLTRLDPEPEYGAPPAPPVPPTLADRFEALSDAQMRVFVIAREHNSIWASLGIAEHYPYPAPRVS